MGKPAARALIDKGAHTGPITKGSSNVMIGGKPAARVGDPLTCSTHGTASIVEGSKSVFINGKPAARMGDKTNCGTPPAEPPKGAEDKMTVLSPARNKNPDGTVKTQYPKNLTVKPLYFEYGLKDKTKDGNYDQAVAGFGLLDLKVKGEKELFGKDKGGIGGSAGFSVLKGEGAAGMYGSNGLYGAETTATGSVYAGDAEAYIGSEKMKYLSGKAEGKAFTAEHEATAVLYTGGSDKKYGFNLQSTEEAAMLKGSLEATSDLYNPKDGKFERKKNNQKTKLNLKVEGDAGSVGWNLGAGGYYDTDDYVFNAKLKMGAHFVLGLKINTEVTINFKPFVDLFDFLSGPGNAGTILTGCNSVLIG
jgi:uncharacterized Zn-binding protein involved in type VI secretion